MGEPISELIAAVAGRVPHAVALADDHDTLTYSELQKELEARRSERGPLKDAERAVALVAEPSIDACLDLLSLIGLARSVCLIDPALSEREQQRLMEHGGADPVVGPAHRSTPR